VPAPTRHPQVLYILEGAIQESKAAIRATKEPHLHDLYERVVPTDGAPPAATTDARADIFVQFSTTERLITDITICSPDPDSSSPGKALLKIIKHKKAKYHRQFRIPDAELNIFAIENTGRLCTQARDLIQNVATRAATASYLPKDYAKTSAAIYQRIYVAVQKGNAAMIAAAFTSCCGIQW
jgi:hypothetical protein